MLCVRSGIDPRAAFATCGDPLNQYLLLCYAGFVTLVFSLSDT